MTLYTYEIEVTDQSSEGEERNRWQFVAYRTHQERAAAEQTCASIAKRLHSVTRMLIPNPAARNQLQHVFTYDGTMVDCGICGRAMRRGQQCTRCDDGRE